MQHTFLFELDKQFIFNTVMTLIGIASFILTVRFFFVLYKFLRKNTLGDSSKKETSENKEPLCAILKTARMNHHYTQEYVAEALGVSRQTVSKWEKGSAEPTMANLSELIKLYQLDPSEIFS